MKIKLTEWRPSKKSLKYRSSSIVYKNEDGSLKVQVVLVAPRKVTGSQCDEEGKYLTFKSDIVYFTTNPDLGPKNAYIDTKKKTISGEFFLDVSKPRKNWVNGEFVAVGEPTIWIVDLKFVQLAKRLKDIAREKHRLG